MKKSKFTETQIVKAIQELDAGRKAEDICREMGITTAGLMEGRSICGKSIFGRFRCEEVLL